MVGQVRARRTFSEQGISDQGASIGGSPFSADTSPNTTYTFTDADDTGDAIEFEDTDGGLDTIDVSAFSRRTTIDLLNPNNSQLGYTLLNFDDNHITTVFGGTGDDTITTNFYNDTLYGGDGDDTLQYGVSGTVALLNGGNGNNSLFGHSGSLAIAQYVGIFDNFSIDLNVDEDDPYFQITGPGGTDSLLGVQVASFTDATYLLNYGDGSYTELFGADATVTVDQTGMVITDSAADVTANIVAIGTLVAQSGGGKDNMRSISAGGVSTGSLIGSITFTDSAPQLTLTDSTYGSFTTVKNVISGSYSTALTHDDSTSETSTWNGGTQLSDAYRDADGNLTEVDFFHVLDRPYDQTVSLYTAGFRTEIDYLAAGDTLYVDLFQKDGSRQRVTQITGQAYTKETRKFDKTGALTQIDQTGYTTGPFTSKSIAYGPGRTILGVLTSGYTNQNYTARAVFYGSGGIVTRNIFLGYGGQPTAQFAINYDNSGNITSSALTGVTGRNYSSITKTYQAQNDYGDGNSERPAQASSGPRLIATTYTDFNAAGETHELTYDPDGRILTNSYSGIPGRAYTGSIATYSGGVLYSLERNGYTSGSYTALTTVFKYDGTTDHTVFALTDGEQRIVGTSGADILHGASGDLLFGSGGADRFVIDGTGATVQDFHSSQSDKFDLSELFDGSASFLGTKAFDGGTNEVRYDRQGANAFVSIDFDGNKSADLTFTVNNTSTLYALDFLLGSGSPA